MGMRAQVQRVRLPPAGGQEILKNPGRRSGQRLPLCEKKFQISIVQPLYTFSSARAS